MRGASVGSLFRGLCLRDHPDRFHTRVRLLLVPLVYKGVFIARPTAALRSDAIEARHGRRTHVKYGLTIRGDIDAGVGGPPATRHLTAGNVDYSPVMKLFGTQTGRPSLDAILSIPPSR